MRSIVFVSIFFILINVRACLLFLQRVLCGLYTGRRCGLLVLSLLGDDLGHAKLARLASTSSDEGLCIVSLSNGFNNELALGTSFMHADAIQQ